MAKAAKRSAAPKRGGRMAITSYPLPTPEAVSAMHEAMFRDRFVDNYLSALLARASHAVSEEINADIDRHGFSINEWRVLASLADNPGLTLADIVELTLVKQPTVTRLVARLEKQGLITKATDADDRRLTRLALTRRGKAEIADLIEMATERQRRILDGLDADRLVGALRHLIAFCAAKRRRRRPRF